MSKNQTSNTLLHTAQTKKSYSEVENTIKKALTEYLTLSCMDSSKNYMCSGLSITPDFEIRELNLSENKGDRMNVAHIKSSTLEKTKENIVSSLFLTIDEQVENQAVAVAYKRGIENFFKQHTFNNIKKMRKSPLLNKFLFQYRDSYKSEKKEDITSFNILSQVAKIFYAKFGDAAFEMQKDPESGKEKIQFSPLCQKYCQVLFFNAIEVWEKWGHNISEIFHDGDYCFITDNDQGSMDEYLDAIYYLVSREKYNPFGRRNEHGEGNKTWAKKTTQFADILWALTNEVFGLHKKVLKGDDKLEFSWDDVTKNLLNISKDKLQSKIDTYNTYFLNSEDTSPLELTHRNKSLPSAVEKVIEGKNLTDITGLRVSIQKIEKSTFDLIQEKVIIPWFQEFSTDIQLHPEYYGVEKGEQLRIGKVQIDNKNVLDEKKINDLIDGLKNAGIAANKRKKPPSNYIGEDDWTIKMQNVYPEDIANKLKFDTFSAFFKQFSGGKKRGVNGDYKDFKFTMEIEILDQEGSCKEIRTMEIQFDDTNNNKGLANFNIRNIERTVNTQSNLTFDLSLEQIRKITEANLKKMWKWAKNKSREFQMLDFGNGE
ncbi:MAG: hypothetical protein DLD55_02220, partial [candidate division SR1 bacterium]